jgi:hypothetical protein
VLLVSQAAAVAPLLLVLLLVLQAAAAAQLLLLVRPVQAPAVHLLQPLPHLGAMLCRVLAQLPDQVLEMLLGRLPARELVLMGPPLLLGA